MFEMNVNKIASDNEINVNQSLVHNEFNFEGIDKVSSIAYTMAMNENIPIKHIPPKIAMPLIEKMSLENESDMYEKWAKLLIATGVNPNPIHQQFADILANLNNKSANFLREIFENQSDSEMESKYEESINKYKFQVFYNNEEINRRRSFDPSEYGNPLNPMTPFYPLPTFFHFPLIICGTEESAESTTPYYENDMAVVNKYNILKFSDEDNNLLLVLEKLGLIKYYFLLNEEKKDEEGKLFYVRKCGTLLTKFGYSFVDCLENPTK
jgi:hypothetical protein